jgi:hypothetical protein
VWALRFLRVVFLVAGLLSPRIFASQPQEQPDRATPDQHIKSLTASLPADSHWLTLLRRGVKGDGLHHPWMDDMRKAGVKLATFTVEFTWAQNGRERRDWEVVSENYFHDYDQLDAITDPRQLSLIQASGLERQLKEAALARAKIANWIEYPAEEHGKGYRWVPLADNEWLPVDLPPFFGRSDPEATPLMQAAAFGDISRIKRLLGQGEDVNEVNSKGQTALIYAAGSGSPAAVNGLIKAGADVNANAEQGGSALVAAVSNNRPKNVAILLKAGADPNSRTADGKTVRSLATNRHYMEILQLLEHAGALH